jgi:hypothetical protein
MLRFIFALDADIRAAKRRSAHAAKSIAAHRSYSADAARGLRLVESGVRRQAIPASALRSAYFQSEQQRVSKGA